VIVLPLRNVEFGTNVMRATGEAAKGTYANDRPFEVAVAVSAAVKGRSDTTKSDPNEPGAEPTKSEIAWSRLTLVYEAISGFNWVASSLSKLSMTGVMASPPSPVKVPAVVSAWAPDTSTSPMVHESMTAATAMTPCCNAGRRFISPLRWRVA
jgi:hypothetical protein